MLVSVVVPVWNPGPNFERCIASLLAQTISRDEYEIVLVDDGSTDGTADVLDRLAEQHPRLVRVLHIPSSGWPGRPRNVGIDAARGEFVHLVDNDDTLPPYALQALVSAAVEHDADVALGRPASDFRGLNHALYGRPSWCGTLWDEPDLTTTLTPHKMFRRALLVRYGIRFPEGPVPLEDQMFVIQAYVHARRIAVLTDRVYYSYLRRVGSGRNAGDRPIDAFGQSRAVEKVLDLITDAVEDPQRRNRLFRRFYRVNLLARLSDRSTLAADDTARDELVAEIRRLAVERFGPGVTDNVGAAHRIQGRLLLDEDTPGLLALAAEYQAIGLRLDAHNVTWRGDVLHFDLDGGVVRHGELLTAERTDHGWALPADLAPGVAVQDRLLDDTRDEPYFELSLVSRATSASFAAKSDLHLVIDPNGVLRVRGHVAIDPLRVLAGGPLEDGVWDLRGRMRFAGWNRACVIRTPDRGESTAPRTPLTPAHLADDGRAVIAFLEPPTGMLTLDVGQWTVSLAEQLAGTAQLHSLGRRRVELRVAADSAAGSLPRAQLLLRPTQGGTAAVLCVEGSLRADADREGCATALFTLPKPVSAGQWEAWLRLPDGVVDVAAPLPWRVDTTGDVLTVSASEPARS